MPVEDCREAIKETQETLALKAALRAAEDRAAELQDFVENVPEGMHRIDAEGVIRWANRAELESLGYAPEQYVGRPMADFHADPALAADILERLRNGEKVFNRQGLLLCRGGGYRFVVLSASGIFRGAQFAGARFVTRELTPERDVHLAQARLAAIVDGSDDAIVSKDLDGTIRSWNRGAERLFGYKAEEMIGESIFRIVPTERHGEVRDILRRIAAGERLDHYETVRQRRDGRRVEVSLTVSPLTDMSGRIIGASKIARDVSLQSEAQRKKDQFLAVLAHELRNPLSPIRNALAIVRDSALASEMRERVLAMADRQMVHLTRLLDDLLDVARLTTGRVELRRDRMELGALARQAAEAARPYMEERSLAFSAHVPPQPLWLEADAVRVSQVVGNLLTNAAKYTDPGGRVDLEVERAPGTAIVRVRDSGIGIPAALKPRLFTLFEQGEARSTRGTGGLGIGLALVREFVERHGGTVEAESDGPGQGSVFTVRLPLSE